MPLRLCSNDIRTGCLLIKLHTLRNRHWLLERYVLGEAELQVRADDVGRGVLEEEADEQLAVHVDEHVARLPELSRHEVANFLERSDRRLLHNVAADVRVAQHITCASGVARGSDQRAS